VKSRFEPRAVGLTLDDEVIAVGGESVDGALCANGVGESGEPLIGPAVGSEDHGAGVVTFEEDLVGIATLMSIHDVESEVIDDEQRRSEKLAELLFEGLGETSVLERLEHAVGAKSEHGVASATSEVSESVGEKGFSDADVANDGEVVMRFDEPKGGEFGEQSLVEVNPSGGVPVFESRGGLEPSLLGAQSCGETLAALGLIGEDEKKEVLVRGFLLASEDEPLRQSIEHTRELETAKHGSEVGFNGFGHCDSPFWDRGFVPRGRAYC
jgi:hypothetical protein